MNQTSEHSDSPSKQGRRAPQTQARGLKTDARATNTISNSIFQLLARIKIMLAGTFKNPALRKKNQHPQPQAQVQANTILSGAQNNQTRHTNTTANFQADPENDLDGLPKKQNALRKTGGFLWRITRPFIGTVLSSFLTVSIIGLFMAFVQIAPRVDKNVDLWNINRQSSIVMLDMNGDEMMSRGARYGEAVSVDELPPFLISAFLSTEDRRFYEHMGVDLRGTLRAAVTNHKSGSVVEGGSTITQQLAKILFLSPERTYTRKIREALLALWLEGHYTKDQLLSIYLNRIYLGAGAYGVEAAAKIYFDKSARNVTLAEAAMLAGLPKAPSSLAPTQHPKAAERRSQEVIRNLLDTKSITQFDYRVAIQNPAELAENKISPELGYAFDYIVSQATNLVGEQSSDLIIMTTLDPTLQNTAQLTVQTTLANHEKLTGSEQAALISFDLTGATRALIGGRDYRRSQFNRVTQAKRQPGSAFKPFVYIAGLEAGISVNARYVDEPVEVNGWTPRNYSEVFSGPIRLTEAMARSINTVSVQVSEEVGREKVAEVAKRLGITAEFPAHPSIALGAVDLTLKDLTTAYLSLARGGNRVTPFIIQSIHNQNGDILYTYERGEATPVLSVDVSEDINHLLHQVMLTGTGRSASLGKRNIAGKTGTTNDWRDAWFMGYSAQIVTGVWIGNDNNQPMENVTGGSVPAEIWRGFMTAAHQNLPLKNLPGAYPAKIFSNNPVLLDFYADVTRGFNKITRERNIIEPRRQRSRPQTQDQRRGGLRREKSNRKKRRRRSRG